MLPLSRVPLKLRRGGTRKLRSGKRVRTKGSKLAEIQEKSTYPFKVELAYESRFRRRHRKRYVYPTNRLGCDQ